MTISLLAATLGLLFFISFKLFVAKKHLKKYRPLIDLDSEISSKGKQLEITKAQLTEIQTNYDRINTELKIFNDDYDLISSGFYKSKYDFDDSQKYVNKLDEIRGKQKQLIKDKNAIVCITSWTVGGSKVEGKKMIDRVIKLGLSAFNVQCDNEILKVKFDNVDRAEAKIQKIRETVDKLLEPNQCHITNDFLKLKRDELFLAYEYQEQLQKEKEEQRQLREQMKEEEKARREIEKIQADAEKDEKRYQEALEKARKEIDKKSESERSAYASKILDLESKLKEAIENKERAKSQAELTRRGHVYIISNIGSFGENVYKIGMTRRLDPMDRIYELGDASVPFDFDVHAMVYSEDAPTLEKQLHNEFVEKRVNQINQRKEFFEVELKEIEIACKKHHGGEFKLTLIAEAKEYRQTIARTKHDEKKAA